jgi:ribonuclease BN (tRNA processing enzyme)
MHCTHYTLYSLYTCDSRLIKPIAMGADLMVHEATMEDTMHRKAMESQHRYCNVLPATMHRKAMESQHM